MRIGFSLTWVLLAAMQISCAYSSDNPADTDTEITSENSSFFLSYQEIRAIKERQLAKELEQTISGFKGVQRVTVHISLKDARVNASRSDAHSKAAVVLWMSKSSPAEIKKVKSVVAASSVDLEREYIDVIQNDASLLRKHVTRAPGKKSNYRLALMLILIICLSGAFGMLIIGLKGRLVHKKSHSDKKEK